MAAQRWRRVLLVSDHSLQNACAGKRFAAGQQVEKRAGQAVNVGAMVDVVRIFGLFGSHVINGSHVRVTLGQAAGNGLGEGIAGVDDPGEAQVEHADCALAVDHEVAGLDIAMNDSLFVGGLKAAGGLDQVIEGVGDRQGSVFADDAFQVDPLDVVHHQEMDTTVFIGLESGDQVEVLEPCGRLELAAETLDGAGVASE